MVAPTPRPVNPGPGGPRRLLLPCLEHRTSGAGAGFDREPSPAQGVHPGDYRRQPVRRSGDRPRAPRANVRTRGTGSRPMTTQENTALVRRLLAEVITGGDLDLADQLLAQDFVLHLA